MLIYTHRFCHRLTSASGVIGTSGGTSGPRRWVIIAGMDWHAAIKCSVRLTRSVFKCLGVLLLVLQFWGELSVILSRNAGPYIYIGEHYVTTYFLKHKGVTVIYKYILNMSLLAYLLFGRWTSMLGCLLCPSQHSPLPCIWVVQCKGICSQTRDFWRRPRIWKESLADLRRRLLLSLCFWASSFQLASSQASATCLDSMD